MQPDTPIVGGQTSAPASNETAFATESRTLPKSRSADVSRRTRRYVISMTIRMVCLALMIVVPGPWKLVMLAGAVILPLFAVLVANDQEIDRAVVRENIQQEPLRIAPSHDEGIIRVNADGSVSELTSEGWV